MDGLGFKAKVTTTIVSGSELACVMDGISASLSAAQQNTFPLLGHVPSVREVVLKPPAVHHPPAIHSSNTPSLRADHRVCANLFEENRGSQNDSVGVSTSFAWHEQHTKAHEDPVLQMFQSHPYVPLQDDGRLISKPRRGRCPSKSSHLPGFTPEQSSGLVRLMKDLFAKRPDIKQKASMSGVTSNRPMDILRAVAALQTPQFFSHCPKTSGLFKSRFSTFSTSLSDRAVFDQQTVNGVKHNTVAFQHTNSTRLVATWVIPPSSTSPASEWEVYNSLQQAGWEDDLEGIYVPGKRLCGEALRKAGFPQAVCDDIDSGYNFQFTTMPKVFHGKNYSSWQDNPVMAQSDFARLQS